MITAEKFKEYADEIVILANKAVGAEDFCAEYVHVDVTLCECGEPNSPHMMHYADIDNGERNFCSDGEDSIEEALQSLENSLKEIKIAPKEDGEPCADCGAAGCKGADNIITYCFKCANDPCVCNG